jgi:plasmid maintenance system antidote protein VapI
MNAKKQSLSRSAKVQLIYRGQSVTSLAMALGFDRSSVSLVIHGRRKMPRVEAAVRKALDL